MLSRLGLTGNFYDERFCLGGKTEQPFPYKQRMGVVFPIGPFSIANSLKPSLLKHMVMKHYYNFRYLTNMLKIRSLGKDRAQYFNVNQI